MPAPIIPLPGRSVRVRVLATMMIFIAAGLTVAGVITYSVLFANIEERVDRELQQEVAELQVVAESAAAQGEPFTQVEDLLRAATDAAVPSEYESMLTLTDGEPRFRPRTQDFDLSSPEVINAIHTHSQAGRTVYFNTESPANGELRVMVASVRVEGDPTEGTLVVANAIGTQRDGAWGSVQLYTLVSLLTLAAAGIVGWLVAGSLLRPLKDLREASSQITVEDLTRRVPQPDTHDEVAELASNFNRMLDRLQDGYQDQHQFLRDVGHELRTPITIVHGTIEMMDPEDPEDYAESRTIALDELERMGRLVGDLSVLAQLGQPNFVQRAEVDMAAFAEDAIARLSHIDERPWRLDRAAPIVAEVDQQRLMQAVIQLGANAVRYSDPGAPVTLTVDGRTSTHGTDVAISVVDQGDGIAPEDQVRVFDKFVRINSNHDRAGSGLGLSIVNAIAEAHQGRVEVESVAGQGSRFTILVPQHPPETTGEQPAIGENRSPDFRPERSARSTFAASTSRTTDPNAAQPHEEETRAHPDR